jgi:hypothetical protein
MDSGYSKTPLIKKLGIKPNDRIILWHPPADYFQLLGETPKNILNLDALGKERVDFIHVFIRSLDELEAEIGRHMRALEKTGMLWISWPKGKAGERSGLKRDVIREYVLGLGLVDVKVTSVDVEWSGLKFVVRLKDR